MKPFRIFAVAISACLPLAVSAGDIAFSCSVEDAVQPEMTARLFQKDGETTGLVAIGGAQMEALIYEAPDSRTFLFLGDDYSLSYTVNLTTGTYEYFADGSKSAEADGTCVAAPGHQADTSPVLKS